MTRRPSIRYLGTFGAGLLAGIVATLLMVLLMVVGRYWLGISPPPEALPDRFAPELSIDRFFELFNRFGGYNELKKFGIRSGLIGLAVTGAVVGILYAAVTESKRSRRSSGWRGGVSRSGLLFVAGAAAILWLGSVIVYRMNGEPLPRTHGFPARVIVPGLFGEKNVKWVTGIDVIDHDGKGFYEKQGWGPNFVIPTRSDIFSPRWRRSGKGDNFDGPFRIQQPVTIKGRAFGGDRGVSLVEVSVDSEQTWQPARIDYPGARLTWTFWSFTWRPATLGEHTIVSRAVDGDGAPRIAETRGIAPQGATGYHRVKALVA